MLEELIKNKDKIHTRDISLATYPHKNGQVIVHGILKDKRHITIFDVTGQKRHPGVIHHMDVKLLIAPDPLRIIEAEASMPQVPMKECPETLDTIEGLKGLEIRSGFSGRLRELMGGPRGCTHLCHLVTVMGQEIVHGWLTQKRKDNPELPKNVESLTEAGFLVDSCRMWVKGGPKLEGLIKAIENQK